MATEVDSKPILSVLVPVFNTSCYLNQCLNSLINQDIDYKKQGDLEIILVDDGSTDASGEICDEWAIKDHRIKVIHQENSGSASARQCALEHASGEYVIVCDSDDWVETCAYRKAYEIAKRENADMVFFGYIAEYHDGHSQEWIRHFTNLSDIEQTRNEIMMTQWTHSWNKLIRRSLFENNNISYTPGINMGEDALILHKLLCMRPLKIATIDEALYHYRISTGGYTTVIKPEYISQLIAANDWIKANIDNELHRNALLKSFSDLSFESLRCDRFQSKTFSKITSAIPLNYLLSTPRSPQKLIVAIAKVFGWKIGRMAYLHLLPQIIKRIKSNSNN